MGNAKKVNFKLISLLTILGVIGVIAIFPYQITVQAEFLQDDVVNVSTPVMLVVNALTMGGTLFILNFLAERMLRRTGLGTPILNAMIHKKTIPPISLKWIIYGIGLSFVSVLIILLLDVFIFETKIDVLPPWWQGMLAILYGGMTEELVARFFVMTLIVWLLAKLTNKSHENIPAAYFYIGIIGASLLFGLGHLPTTVQIFGEITALIVLRGLVLNGILGIWFGYLYWKKGLEYAMIAHMSADLFLHVILGPIFYSLYN